MKFLLALTLATAGITAGTAVEAQTAAGGNAPDRQCAKGYVTGVGGSAQSIREYLAIPDRDKFRYIADNPIQCQVSDDGRASNCTGITTLRHEEISVYDDSDSATMAVVTRVELDHGANYPVIIVVPKKDVQCDE